MVNEPISSDSFLITLPTIQIFRSYKTTEEKRYFLIQSVFALFAMTLTYSVGIWLGHVKPLALILPLDLLWLFFIGFILKGETR